VQSYRLGKSYFVTERAAYDLRADQDLKRRLDERVEKDIVRKVETKCEEAKRIRT
jgi:hypothetical protein